MAVKNKEKKNPATDSNANSDLFPFTRENYLFMLIGVAVITVGYLLMIGGKSPDPNEFFPKQIYSFRRITLAPIVIILGVLVEIYAIFKKPKAEKA